MDPIVFSAAIDQIAEAKGISHDAVIGALKEALERAYTKYLGGGDDAVVEANINEETGFISLAQKKKIVATDDDVQDDYLEIALDDAKGDYKDTLEHLDEELSECPKAQKADYNALIALVKESEPTLKVGEYYPMYCPLEELSKLTAMAVKSNLRVKIAEAERLALYDIYKDHIGELVTGTVEKSDEHSVSVNIGRTTVEVSRREMIGDEDFKIGDPIKVYIQEVKAADQPSKGPRGSQIEVTRSSEGFLKRLFEEEIHEIYDGTVIIKGIAREAGVRSKVAVYSNNEDVDPTGACIGPGGSRIQKIVSQLGNGKEKEKIDIIAYSDNPGLYIAESLRPAQVLGVLITDPDNKPFPKATAVVKDDALSLAIGKKGANARLANKLTGYSIDIIPEEEAKSENLVYTSFEDLAKQAEDQKKEKEKAVYAEKSRLEAEKKAEEEAAAKKAAEEAAVTAPAVEPVIETPAPAEEAAPAPEAVSPAAPTPVQPVAEPEPVAPLTPTEVKTTTTLDALEKELEEAKKEKRDNPDFGKEKDYKKFDKSKNRRPRHISDDEVEHVKPGEVPANAMPIYSQEELDEIAKEESYGDSNDNGSEDIDIDQYDKYYDDDGK